IRRHTPAPTPPPQNPPPRNPPTNDPTHQNSRPLITKMKRPRVKSVTGSVRMTRTGRISVLMSPSTSAAINADVKEPTLTHGNTYGSRNKAAALISHTSRSRSMLPPLSRTSHAIGLHSGVERRVDGCRQSRFLRHARDGAGPPGRLEPIACVEVMQHRRLHLGRQSVAECHLARDKVVR